MSKTYIAGSNLTTFLAKLLTERGCKFTSYTELDIVRDIKEKLCFVALDYKYTLKNSNVSSEYEMPDGKRIIIGNERFSCPEYLFNPEMNYKEMPSI